MNKFEWLKFRLNLTVAFYLATQRLHFMPLSLMTVVNYDKLQLLKKLSPYVRTHSPIP
ncbi:MAG: hypothetical protein LVQ96_06755 [Thermoplasmatales archaeon]|nr:hypothetical protein [Thermoplasmatales archaeon]